jgi:hypothetical protein
MVAYATNANKRRERTMNSMNILNLVFAIAVVGALAAVCRTAYLKAQHRRAEPTRLETAEPVELERAA